MTWTLVAVDGSEQAEHVTSLVASIAWPSETVFGVVAVVPTLQALSGGPYAPVAPSNLDEVESAELRKAQIAASTAAADEASSQWRSSIAHTAPSSWLAVTD